MAILHKNISAEGDIHNPKWFSGANNGDVAWRNELGVLESTDELVLPAALNFVDGSVAPPTSNNGDIYVLSSGASVNAGWGTVALGDWVRYDGTAWNVITPQKSTLCYNETLDKLFSYSGSVWAEVGGGGGTDVNAVHVNAPSEISGITAKATPTASDLLIIEDVADGNNKKKITIGDLPSSGGGASIYTANDTIGTGRVATLTDTLTFKDGIFEIQGIGTTGSSALAIYNGDGTPAKLWDFLDNGTLTGNKAKCNFIPQNSTVNSITDYVFNIRNSLDTANIFFVGNGGEVRLGNAINNSTNDKSTHILWGGDVVTQSGFGNYSVLMGDTLTANYSGNGVVAIGRIISLNAQRQAGIGDTINFIGEHNYGIGRKLDSNSANSNMIGLDLKSNLPYSNLIGRYLETSATGASLIGNGNTSTGVKLVNNTANSLGLGWGTTTPQHLFKSNGVNLTLPTSSSGLSLGDLYNDSGTVKIVV